MVRPLVARPAMSSFLAVSDRHPVRLAAIAQALIEEAHRNVVSKIFRFVWIATMHANYAVPMQRRKCPLNQLSILH